MGYLVGDLFFFVYPTFAWFTPESNWKHLAVYWSLGFLFLVFLVLVARKRRSKAKQ